MSLTTRTALPRAVSFKIPSEMQSPFSTKSVPLRAKTVIVGGGQLAIPTLLRSLQQGNEVVVCTSDSKQLEGAIQEAGVSSEFVSFISTTYKQGSDADYWKSRFRNISADASSMRVVNTRGISSLPLGKTYNQIIRDPAEALLTGFCKGTTAKMQRAFVNCSSSTASIEGFADKHPYARCRKETDSALTQLAEAAEIPGYNLRFDLVKSSRGVNTMTSPNHGVSPLELTHAPFQFIIDDEKLLTIQPVSEEQAAKAILCPEIYKRGSFATIDAVGPEAYSQLELYQFYSNLYQRKLRIIRVPFSVAKWAAKYISLAQLTYGVDLLQHRSEHAPANKPLDHKEFEKLVQEPLLCIKGIYASFGGPVIGIRSPTQMLVRKAGAQLLKNAEARSDFLSGVIPHVPSMTLQAAQSFSRKS